MTPTRQWRRRRGHMSSPAEAGFPASASNPTPTELPPLPSGRWWGDHLRETRWQLELYRLLVDPVLWADSVPRGDGRPVILMPGFGGGDQTLVVLALWLRRIGYQPSTCGFVANLDCADRALDRVERRLENIHCRHERRVALIGHSRGGHYARALGHRRPELVSHAISVGAGLRQMLSISYPTQLAAAGVRHVLLRAGRARSDRCLTDSCDCAFGRDFAAEFPADRVRLTSIYSKGDGVVRWQASLVPHGDCVEVTGSHVGLIFNRKTYRMIATALAAPEFPA
jgi:pimeloyl-ACP methyl ester carboxylesterase